MFDYVFLNGKERNYMHLCHGSNGYNSDWTGKGVRPANIPRGEHNISYNQIRSQ